MAPPKYRGCRFCGELFGSASLPIHEKRCRNRPHDLISHESPPAPPSPARGVETKTPPPPTISSSGPLQPCRHCGRTFDPSRLSVHERVCLHDPARSTSRRTPARSGSSSQRIPIGHRAPSRWRQQHEELLSVVRGHRRGGGARRPPRAAAAAAPVHRPRHVVSVVPSSAPSPGTKANASRVGASATPAASPSRRLTAAQRHAQEWSAMAASASAAALAPSSPPRTPPRQLLERARERACACTSPDAPSRLPAGSSPPALLSSAACGSFYGNAMAWRAGYNPTSVDARAGYSRSASRGGGHGGGGGLYLPRVAGACAGK